MSDTKTTSRIFNGTLIPLPGMYTLDPVHTFAEFITQHLVVGEGDASLEPLDTKHDRILRTSRRLRADRLFGLDTSAPVGHRLDQLADLLARTLIAQLNMLVEEAGSAWHQHLRVGYHNNC